MRRIEMFDFTKPIPNLEFKSGKRPVENPSNEPLVYMDDEFLCDSKYFRWVEQDGKSLPGSSPSIMCRKTVLEMVKKAESLLPEGYRFVIFDAYRPIAVQQALWDYFRAIKASKMPGATDEEIDREVLYCVSFPSYNILLPSLHNTGGAVDLTVVGPDGRELDMGCEFDEFSEAAWAAYYEDGQPGEGMNDEARDNRRMLSNAMTAVGFTLLPSEWWHFDYGDEKWALYTDNAPIYAGNLDAEVKDSVPYAHMELVREANRKQLEPSADTAARRELCAELDEEIAKVMRKQPSRL